MDVDEGAEQNTRLHTTAPAVEVRIGKLLPCVDVRGIVGGTGKVVTESFGRVVLSDVSRDRRGPLHRRTDVSATSCDVLHLCRRRRLMMAKTAQDFCGMCDPAQICGLCNASEDHPCPQGVVACVHFLCASSMRAWVSEWVGFRVGGRAHTCACVRESARACVPRIFFSLPTACCGG